jgi:hypothetical protein
VQCSTDACFPAIHLSTVQSFNDVSLAARSAVGLISFQSEFRVSFGHWREFPHAVFLV